MLFVSGNVSWRQRQIKQKRVNLYQSVCLAFSLMLNNKVHYSHNMGNAVITMYPRARNLWTKVVFIFSLSPVFVSLIVTLFVRPNDVTIV